MTDDCPGAWLRLVADRRRRELLQQLRHHPGDETPIEEVVDRLLGAGTAAGIERTRDRERLLVQLQHVHLPKLDDHGVVEYDLERGTVRYQPDDRIEAVLDSLPEEAPQPPPDSGSGLRGSTRRTAIGPPVVSDCRR